MTSHSRREAAGVRGQLAGGAVPGERPAAPMLASEIAAMSYADLMLVAGFATSKGDARRQIAGGAAVEAYGVWVEKSMYGRKYMGIDRSTFVIDPQGKIARVWRKVKVPGHVAEVLEAVQAL